MRKSGVIEIYNSSIYYISDVTGVICNKSIVLFICVETWCIWLDSGLPGGTTVVTMAATVLYADMYLTVNITSVTK